MARLGAAVASVLVFAVTGYGWSLYRQLDGGWATSDVLGGPRAADGARDILLVGLDSRTDGHGDPLPPEVLAELHAGEGSGELNTDTVMLIRVPNDPARGATAISIPRDAYVEIPGYGTHKINSAYARAANTERAALAARGVSGAELNRAASLAGRRSLVATVERLTGASIDHYAEVNLAGFTEITRAVGGVEVCLAAPTRDEYSGADFAAGPQRLTGGAALAFVRQRHGLPRGDLDRIVRQQAFLAGLAHQMLSAGTLANPVTAARLIGVVQRYVVLDEGFDLLGLATQAQALTGGNIQFRTIPTGTPALRTPADGVAVEVDPALVREFVAGLSADPATAPAGPDGDESGEEQQGPVTVDVSNANGRTGLAAATQDLLDDHGFVPGRLDNAPPRGRSIVRAAPDTRAAAERVAQLLGGLPVQPGEQVPRGHVQVLLGRDYPATPGPGGGGGGGGRGVAPPPGDDAPGAPPTEAVITAAGVPCVN